MKFLYHVEARLNGYPVPGGTVIVEANTSSHGLRGVTRFVDAKGWRDENKGFKVTSIKMLGPVDEIPVITLNTEFTTPASECGTEG